VLAKTVARTLDLNDDRVVKKPIQECRGNDGIAKNITPLGEAAIGGEDHGAFLISGIDELEEQIAATWDDRQIANLIDDKERGAG